MKPASDAAGESAAPAVEGLKLAKSFGGVRALDSASFSARRGEVHALVGENGAGKSTLIKLLGGRLRPDAGEIRVHGRAVEITGPERAHALGVGTVFQELTLLPWMTVAENLLIRREPRGRLGLIDRRRMTDEAEAILAGLGVRNIDPRALIEDLSLAKRQMVEIARVIAQKPETILLDEPTSSLGDSEVDWLFGLVRELRAQKRCIIFTSHRWNEITDIANRITIYRNGKDVGTFAEIEEGQAVSLMTGQRLEALFPKRPALAEARAMLEARSLTGPGLAGVSLTLRAHEILGVGGLAGQGHRELFFSLFGAAPTTGGEIVVAGRRARIKSPRDAARLGMALVPEDRKTEGLLLPMSVGVNLTLAVLAHISAMGVLRRGRERGLAGRMIEALKIRTPDLGNPVGRLSGGNQQKVLLARWLLADSRIILLYDVTRGVDIATKHEIYELMMRLAGEGRALLFYSSDAEELAHLCHRVLVMREGRIAAELQAPGVTAEDIVSAAVRESDVVT
ncbi:MAG TPA: sugar ABC transporter ATP-binding protein [Roseiarcus sp.]|jgi:ribose transport system ATP-binding protein|nr:sugar ABC transporter ATP-binding protein [Roseiarcus sp.]